jgi:hypothetical protein
MEQPVLIEDFVSALTTQWNSMENAVSVKIIDVKHSSRVEKYKKNQSPL